MGEILMRRRWEWRFACWGRSSSPDRTASSLCGRASSNASSPRSAIGVGDTQSVDALFEAVWGERPPASARKLLQVYVSQLRKLLPAPAAIGTRGDGYVLELPDGSLDSARFEQLLHEGKDMLAAGNPRLAASRFSRALDLWRGEAFGSLGYEAFAREEAERLAELRIVCLEEGFEAELALGRASAVLPDLRAFAGLHPLRERARALEMLALYRSGRQSEALEVYAAAREHLREELGLEPGPALRDLQGRILRHDAELAAPPGEPTRSWRLPVAPNRLIGRARELDELHALLLRDDVRLLVLSGAGGTGKTRLALATARVAESSFANGAAFVPLATLRDPGLVAATIARTLGVQELPGRQPLDAIVETVRAQELLLILDNAEHLRDAAPLYVDLLAQAPRLTLLVTSRVVLHVSGEHVYPVEPLAEADAVTLFEERALQAGPLPQSSSHEGAVAEIVRRLDGLPLALELAAGRTRSLTPDELLAHLEPRLPLLTGGPRDLPARQQTLYATLDWSHDLLAPDEQRLLARLSVFAGGCTMPAAVDVVDATLDTLQGLVENNLVRHSNGRYSMLETIREYAGVRLDELGATDETARRHAEHFLALVERVEPELEGEYQTDEARHARAGTPEPARSALVVCAIGRGRPRRPPRRRPAAVLVEAGAPHRRSDLALGRARRRRVEESGADEGVVRSRAARDPSGGLAGGDPTVQGVPRARTRARRRTIRGDLARPAGPSDTRRRRPG